MSGGPIRGRFLAFLKGKEWSDRADFFTIVFSTLESTQNHPVPDIDQEVGPFDPMV